MKKKRKYKKRKKHHTGLSGTVTASGLHAKLKQSAIETGKDIVIGVIGGGITGMLLGKSSLLIGAGVTGYGHFENKPFMRTFGMGMMMGGGMDAAKQAMSGLSADDIKARVVSFKDGFLSKLYLDKVFTKDEPKKKALEGADEDIVNMDGMGDNDLDFSTLNKLEQQVLQSGNDYQKKKDEGKPSENLNSSYAEIIDEPHTNY